ncbi:methyl-coenzyme M reductase operon protein D [Methanobacterium alcaliphilum]|uniref:methyl-coenzyme M reductase operon protein D n=1 Tax=Methanobacterium alcaliphilum TaxID=392018 RepID=UPI00200B95D1|nr:methyl-coenzyme M reductase operon protein D [Methanobacterium alcaliphilum]MCK9150964.1 methyl-coenzyme M reductase operon protein D [Methanobacterium alcaliphilum]
MDIQIFPNRILSADTTENLLRDLDKIDGIKRIVLQGQRLPPAELGHPDRRMITVKGQEIDLQIKTGRVLLEIEDEEVIDEIKTASAPHLPFGFDVYVGTFIRHEKTVTDKIKYGSELDDIPDEMVGLTDPNAKLSDRASIIKKKEE